MNALAIVGYVFGGIIVLVILVLVISNIPDWRFSRWVRRDAYSHLLAIKGKGYSWAINPKNRCDYDARKQFNENHIYVQAKTVKVSCIGRLPDGDFVYQGQDGEQFLYCNRNVTSVLIDSAQNVYIPVPQGSELTDNRLVVLSDDLIIPDNYHILTDPAESEDFQQYYSYLATYFGDTISCLHHTELRKPLIPRTRTEMEKR